MVPVYLKRIFADDPIFRDVKVVVSLYGDGFSGELDPGFGAKIAGEGVKDKNLAILDTPSYENLCRFVMEYADGVVAASPDRPRGARNGTHERKADARIPVARGRGLFR